MTALLIIHFMQPHNQGHSQINLAQCFSQFDSLYK
uniref:Uncharacterized protein n=1 Tax=Rhizophora mucronata TaxID=61149 RepID=A0A2P2R1U4_RHIMU